MGKLSDIAPEGIPFSIDRRDNIHDVDWLINFLKLYRYKLKHGKDAYPLKPEDEGLYTWVAFQRQEKKNESLSGRRVKLLKGIGFEWVLTRGAKKGGEAKSWVTNYEKLVQYKKEHGDCNIPRTYQKDRKLANWIWIQRQKKRGKSAYSPLTEDQLKSLNKIGFVWDSRKEKWERNYNELKKHFKKHGHVKFYPGDNLYGFIAYHRELARYGRLDKVKAEALRKVGVRFKF